jgi:hypothetical protein
VRPDVFVAISTTMATLSAVALVWLIEHDCVMPVVRMHFAVFVAAAAVVCTTTQLAVTQRNLFAPPGAAIWTTGSAVDVHVHPAPGQLGPA